MTNTQKSSTGSTVNQYRAASEPLSAVVEAVPPTGWEAPSPCAGWTARDVLGHLVLTQHDMLTQHGADLGASADLQADLEADPARAWRGHVARVLDAVADEALVGQTFDGFFGPTTVGETLVRFYVWDMVVHRWDLARAAGLPDELSDGELDRIEQGADGFGEALHMEGICGPGLDVGEDADRVTRVLARLGRAA